MANEIVLRNASALQIQNFEDLSRLGRVLAKSGYFKDARDEAQAVAKILAGMELGIPPVAALRGVYIVEGQITLNYSLIAALIKQSGRYDYRVRVQTADTCEIEFFENGQSVGVVRTTMKDMDQRKVSHAYKNGSWTKKYNWQAFPENMLFARTMSNGAKWYCPDIFNGPVYTPDELGAEVDGETGEVLDAPAVEVEAAPEPERPRRLLTGGQLKALNAWGSGYYGKEWDAKRAELVSAVTEGRTQSSRELSQGEAEFLIKQLRERVQERNRAQGQSAIGYAPELEAVEA